MQSEKQAAEATVDDHLRRLIQLMKRGGRISVTDIPKDPTFLSSHFGGETVRSMADRLEAALSAAEPVKTPLKVASKHIPEAHVSLLSRAIRQGLEDYGWKNFGTIPEVLAGYIIQAEHTEEEMHPPQTAPSVAVKALEWERRTTISRCNTITGDYHVTFDRHEWQLSFRGVGKTASFNVSRHLSRTAAEAAAQKIHEDALSPYLSAQVRDVARYQSRVEAAHHALFHDDPTDIAERNARSFEESIETAQAFGMTEDEAIALVKYTFGRPVGDPAKELGAKVLTAFSLGVVAGIDVMAAAEADLEKLQRPETIARIRAKRSTRHGRGPLPGFDPAAPAKQEGGEGKYVHKPAVDSGESGDE
jgi:hypothetical protein